MLPSTKIRCESTKAQASASSHEILDTVSTAASPKPWQALNPTEFAEMIENFAIHGPKRVENLCYSPLAAEIAAKDYSHVFPVLTVTGNEVVVNWVKSQQNGFGKY
jgi:hypothetical protein